MMTTSCRSESRRDRQAIKVARIYRMTDPLGAAGFRDPRARIQLEARARRGLFAVVVSIYLAITGAFVLGERLQDNPPPVSVSVQTEAGQMAVNPAPHTTTTSS